MKPVVLSLASLSIFCTATLAAGVVANARVIDTVRLTSSTERITVQHTYQEERVPANNTASTRRSAILEGILLAQGQRSLAIQVAEEEAAENEVPETETKPVAKEKETEKTPAVSSSKEASATKQVRSSAVTTRPTVTPLIAEPVETATIHEDTLKQNDVEDTYLSILVQEIHRLTNLTRQQAGVATLTFSESLSSVATSHSDDMATRDYFEHDSPEGCNAGCRLHAANYSLLAWGENLAWRDSVSMTGPEDLAAHFVDAWMNSFSHRRNLLSENFAHEGVGASLIDDKVYVTVNFAKPR